MIGNLLYLLGTDGAIITMGVIAWLFMGYQVAQDTTALQSRNKTAWAIAILFWPVGLLWRFIGGDYD